jgi:hypothetical protein
MDSTAIIGQVLLEIPGATHLHISAALQQFIEWHRISRTTEDFVTVSTVGWTTATKSFAVPANVLSIDKVYVDGNEIPDTLPEGDVVADSSSYSDDRCLIHNNGTVYFNFALYGSSASVVKLSCKTYDSTLTVATVPAKFTLAAQFYCLYRLYSMSDYKDDAKKVENYSLFDKAYNSVKDIKPGNKRWNIGDDF